MIRLEGADVLCNALRTNKVLTNLDLSYNALGAAAGVLGAALIDNNVSFCGYKHLLVCMKIIISLLLPLRKIFITFAHVCF